jgi:hypothetical protein
LEFTFFKADGGLRLLSTNIVVGNESANISKVSSGSLPAISESAFFNSLDDNGKFVFEKLLTWAKSNSFPIHWGIKGFSLNVDLSGTHVAFCFGYPPNSVYQQSIYSALLGRGGLLSKTSISEQELGVLIKEAQNTGLFQPAGRELKCSIHRKFSEKDIDTLIMWLMNVTKEIIRHGLKGQGEIHT